MAGSPLPQGTKLRDGSKLGRVMRAMDEAYWIHALNDGRRALVMTLAFAEDVARAAPLTHLQVLEPLTFGSDDFRVLIGSGDMDEVSRLTRPATLETALPFAEALSACKISYAGAIYSRDLGLIPYQVEGLPELDKDYVLGRYLSGGIDVPASDVVALERIVTKIEPDDLERIVLASGLPVKAKGGARPVSAAPRGKPAAIGSSTPLEPFKLPGRQALSNFFNEHVIDIVANEARYAALGIGFPGSVILEGPTGCGKTFAVDKLIEHLGWASFSIEAASVASPYIHETSRKVAEVFAAAKKAAPAVIVIDEMDAFLADRQSGTDQHRMEEVAEFLRRIPEASANRVLIVGMTNKIDLIDPAILRRGRFDHVIHVDHAAKAEIEGLLLSLLNDIPHDLADVGELAAELAGRPLSDAAFVVREAGRLAARSNRDRIGTEDLNKALARSPSRNPDDQQRIGF